jgi:hypothetical protein
MSSMARSVLSGVTKLLAVLAIVVLLAFGATRIPGPVGEMAREIISALNPFGVETVDRTGPAVLQSLTELSEFRAASAYYEVVVDLEDDTNNLPDLISGGRVLYVGKGTVAAYVDFSELDERRVVLSPNGKAVTVTLPAPTVDDPELDLENSYVYDLDEGIITKFRGSDLERDAQLEAVDRLRAAATGEDRLVDLAKESTTSMLQGLFGSLDYQDITIAFDE